MPRICTICSHPNKEAINQALIDSVSYRNIAEQFFVSTTALHRHKKDHLPAVLAKAQEVEVIAHGDDLLSKIQQLEEDARRIGKKAESTGDLRAAIMTIRELIRIVDLLARLQGELQAQQVNVLVTSPDWLQLRTAVLRALEHYPEARLAVIEALSV